MSEVDCPEPGTSRAEFHAMWRRQEPFWHGAFAVVWVSAVVVAVLDERGPHGLWPTLLLLLAIAVAYATLGVRGIQQLRGAGVAYQVIAWSLLLAIQLVDPGTESWMLFFILYPQMWAMLEVRSAAVGTLLTLVTFGAVRFWQSGFDSEALGAILISSVISLGISMALGIFINRIVDEAQSRAETIDELRATQARLAAVERDRGVQDERERISREIHDTLAQGFTSVVALARASASALARGDHALVAERVALIEQTALDNLTEARLIVAELSPAHLQSRTVPEALERLAASVTHESGVEVRVEVRGEPVALGGSGDVVLLRTAQEALSNVRRHSGARHTRLVLTYAVAEVRLEIADDGRGFAPESVPSGFGLDGVRARVAELGGTAALASTPGSGTTLSVVLPR